MVEAGVVALVLAFHGVAALSVVAARFVVNGAMFRFLLLRPLPPGQPLALRLPARHPGDGPRLTRPSDVSHFPALFYCGPRMNAPLSLVPKK